MNSMIPIILTSEDFESRMKSNYELTKKTISYGTFRRIMNDTLVDQDPIMQLFI